jgi:MFS family permease
MGWILLLVVAPICAIFGVSTPEAAGLAPPEQEAEETDRRKDLTLWEALASPAFWVFTSASCLFGLAWSAITLYNESVLKSRGYEDQFTTVMAILAGVGLFSNLLGGWLATKIPLGYVLGAGMAVLAVAFLAYPYVETVPQLIGYAAGFGVASGLVTVVHFAFHPQAFGRTHLGLIQGVFQVASVFTSALGPLILALCHEWTDSYTPMFLAIAPLSALLALAAVLVPMPYRPAVSVEQASSLFEDSTGTMPVPREDSRENLLTGRSD